MEFDKENGNILWEDTIKTELKLLKDYQTLIVLYTGRLYLEGIRKNIVSDVKCNLNKTSCLGL
jgi:hypothetical protein